MLVASKPDGDIRICLDPSELNKAIQRQHFAVPTVEQLFAKIGKAKFWSAVWRRLVAVIVFYAYRLD